MVVADPTLASIQMWWWDSLGAAVFAFLGFPAAGCDAGVVFGTGQGEVVDIGLAAAAQALTACDRGVYQIRPVASNVQLKSPDAAPL